MWSWQTVNSGFFFHPSLPHSRQEQVAHTTNDHVSFQPKIAPPLVLVQPDLGTCLMVVFCGITVMFLAGLPMWYFLSAAGAVRSACAIHGGLRDHNAADADFPVIVRIGISAGEPVEQADDLFGCLHDHTELVVET